MASRPFSCEAMFRTSVWGPVTRIEMARSVAGRPLHTVSAFLLGDTLIDSGCPASAWRLSEWARERGVRRVVHTHHHEDHCGGDAALGRLGRVEILAPPRTVPILGDFYRLPVYRRLVWGQPRSVRAAPMGDEVEIGGTRFRVVPTPGHASDHVCLFDPVRRWLFTGDLFIHRRVRYLRSVEDASRMLRSLEEIRRLEPSVLLCSHAGVVEEAPAALDDRIAHWRGLAAAARGMAENGEDPRGITRRLLGREGPMTWISVGDFSKVNLVRSLLSGS